jgi:Peroxiredoxin
MNVKMFFLLTILVLTTSCKDSNKLQNGLWRGELIVSEKLAPFLFEVKDAGTESVSVTIMNGEERVKLSGVYYVEDTVIIPIDSYDTHLRAKITGDKMEGLFIRNYIDDDTGIAFKAEKKNTRFDPVKDPINISLDGRWDVYYYNNNDSTRNVGIFESNNGIITGSILTNTGDLRFLEGVYTKAGAQLSTFGGLSPTLIQLNFHDENTFEGLFYGANRSFRIVGKRNDKAALTSGYYTTIMKYGMHSLSFSLPNMDGEIISINDDRYKDKVVIVSALGTWCPNCLDEHAFLAEWYKENKHRGVEVIGLAFERKDDFEYAQTTINRFKQQHGIDYEILYAGRVGTANVMKVLPELDGFFSYPTTIIIDKQGKVKKIHSGFSGPATGIFYEEFKKEFNEIVDGLLVQ